MGKVVLTKAQRRLLAEFGEEPDGTSFECAAELEWRTAKALSAKGLIEITSDPPERQAAGYWFECIITPAGRAALQETGHG